MERNRTEQGIDELGARVDRGFEEVDRRFGEVDRRFGEIDKRFEQVDKRFEQVDKRFEQVDKRFEQVDKRFEKVEGELREFRVETSAKLDKVNEEFVAMRKEIKDGFEGQRQVLLGWTGSLVVALVVYIFTH